jgi:hypothetical protein
MLFFSKDILLTLLFNTLNFLIFKNFTPMKSNLNTLKGKLSKKQILDALKAKNVKGGGANGCPPPRTKIGG